MSAAPYITVRERASEARPARRTANVRTTTAGATTVRPAKSRPASPLRRHVRVEQVAVKAQPRRSNAGMSGMEFAAAQGVTFAVVAAAAFMLSVLVGNSMAEFERRKAVDAGSRVKTAQSDILRLRQRYDRLNSATEVGDWAVARGFVPAYGELAVNNHVTTD